MDIIEALVLIFILICCYLTLGVSYARTKVIQDGEFKNNKEGIRYILLWGYYKIKGIIKQ